MRRVRFRTVNLKKKTKQNKTLKKKNEKEKDILRINSRVELFQCVQTVLLFDCTWYTCNTI